MAFTGSFIHEKYCKNLEKNQVSVLLTDFFKKNVLLVLMAMRKEQDGGDRKQTDEKNKE